MGLSLTNFLESARKNGRVVKGNPKRARPLQTHSRVTHLFAEKFHPASGVINMTSDDVHTILYPKHPAHKPRNDVAPVHLISALAEALEAEPPNLVPDYLLGHRLCWTFLRNLNTVIQPLLFHHFGPAWMRK